MSLQRGLFGQEQLVVKILYVIARFTASLIVKIQPESTNLIRKFTANPYRNSQKPLLLIVSSVKIAHESYFLFRLSVPTMGMGQYLPV
jgi:hypothetical protein